MIISGKCLGMWLWLELWLGQGAGHGAVAGVGAHALLALRETESEPFQASLVREQPPKLAHNDPQVQQASPCPQTQGASFMEAHTPRDPGP